MRLGLILCGGGLVILALGGPYGPCAGLGIVIGLPLAIIGWLVSVAGLGLALNQSFRLVLGSAAIAASAIAAIVLLGNTWGAWNVFEIESWGHIAVFSWAPLTSATVLLRRFRKAGV
jgi:hypothetical protein